MAFDYNAYIAIYNSGDDRATAERFYTEDVILDGPDARHHGRDALIRVLEAVHEGITERLQPEVVVGAGDHVMAEIVATFTAKWDRPDFLFKPLVAGETLSMRFFASYHLRGDLIDHLTLGCWPAGRAI